MESPEANLEVISISSTPSEIEKDIEIAKENLSESFIKQRDLYEAKLKAATSVFSVSCGPTQVGPYNLRFECPSTISTVAAEPHQDIKMYILSKKFNELFPKQYKSEDENLKIVFNNGKTTITNKSNRYLKVLAISFYYNDKIITDKLDKELPPESESDTPIKNPFYAAPENLTIEKARNVYMKFGIAVKYRVQDESDNKTLYKLNTYPLSECI